MRLVKNQPNIFMLLSPVCCVLVLLLLFVTPSLARDFSNDRRTALVVGNNNYLFGKLNNPVNDAKDMAAALRKLGFQVDLQLDTNRKSFRTAIRDFGNRLQQGGVGLFYFAGHGMQIDGENFLIPVDADIQSEDEIPDYGISANTVLRKMEAAGNPFNMVFLDACRDNPFARKFRSSQSGMARMDAPSGSLIVYATAIGRKAKDGEGRNGTFTASLLRYLPQPNLEVGMLLRQVREDVKKNTGDTQVPWSSSSLIGRFYFKKMDINVSPQQRDHEFWAAVQKSDRAADYRDYLAEFPNGEHAVLARVRIRQVLSNVEEVNSSTENIIQSSNNRERIDKLNKYRSNIQKGVENAIRKRGSGALVSIELKDNDAKSDKYQLSEDMKLKIECMSEYAKRKVKELKKRGFVLIILVEGWVNTSNNSSYDYSLSKKRAIAARDYLETFFSKEELVNIIFRTKAKGGQRHNGNINRYIIIRHSKKEIGYTFR